MFTAQAAKSPTSIYLDYIKTIEAKEETSKDAPTEEVKNNVIKIYNEVTNDGVPSWHIGWNPGMFGKSGATSGAAGNPNNAGPSSAVSAAAAPAPQEASRSGNSLPQASSARLLVSSSGSTPGFPSF